jgi:hypothetical protein
MEDVVAGTAHAIQYRNQISGGYSSSSSVNIQSQTVLTFRVDPGDGSLPVPVQLKGLSIEGDIADGDWVEVGGTWRAGKVMKAKWVMNRTTGVEVEARGTPAWAKVLATIVILAVLGFIAWIAITGFADFPGG